MPKVEFGYDIERDAWSWVVIAKSDDFWGLDWRKQNEHIPDGLLEKIKKADFPSAHKLVMDHIGKDSKKEHKNRVMLSELQALEESWRPVEEKYFKILSAVTQKPVFTEHFGCYSTTGLMCPYNEKECWFMVSMWHSVPFSITTICHEIMHLQFLFHYKDYLKKKGLKKDQIENLKESLTVLLNEPEFGDIILSEDYGYPEHFELREKIRYIWSKNKDFQNLLDEAIRFIKG